MISFDVNLQLLRYISMLAVFTSFFINFNILHGGWHVKPYTGFQKIPP